MIIWGTRSSVKTLAMLTLACRNGHTAAHRLIERTLKFTLFFIPLFPISKTRFTVCTGCGETLKITKEQAAQLLAQVPASAPPAPAAPPAAMPPAVPAPGEVEPSPRPRPTPETGAAS